MIKRTPASIRAGRLPARALMRKGVGYLGLAGDVGGGGGSTLSLPGLAWNVAVNVAVAAPSLVGGGGGSAPAAPTIAGLTLLADFDFGSPTAGAFPSSLAPIAGTLAATAAAVVGASAPTIGTVTGSRRGVLLDGTDDWIDVTGVLATLLATNPDPEFLIATIGRAGSIGATSYFLDISRGTQSGASTLNRYSFLVTSAGNNLWRRANGASNGDATIGTGVTINTTLRQVGRASLNGDQINRGSLNGGAKGSGAARSVTASAGTWQRLAIGASMVNPDGTTMSQFLNGAVERVLIYLAGTANSADDAALDAVETAMASYYT